GRLGAGAIERAVEAKYQDEFYLSCDAVLGSIHLSSEWTGNGRGKPSGRVDFLLTSTGWAIECVRDGDRLEEHIARFQLGGKYYQWITSGQIKDYVIVDFRRSKPRKVRGIDMSFQLFSRYL